MIYGIGIDLVDIKRMERVMDPALTDVSRQLMTLAQDDIRYLIIHKTRVKPDTLAQWYDYLAVPPLYESDELAVYRTYPPHGTVPTLVSEWEPGLGLIQASVRSSPMLSQGAIVTIDARWFATRALNQDLAVRIALEKRETEELAQRESFVVSPDWPTSQWPVGAVVVDNYTWQIDPFAPAGDYSLVLTVGDTLESESPLGQIRVVPLPRLFDAPQMTHALNADFGGEMRLLGYDLRRKGDSVSLALHWQAIRRMDMSYKIFVHVCDEGTGGIVTQSDAVPRRWTYPTTWWEAGEIVSDEIEVSTEGVPPGTYGLAVGVYDPGTGERLAISGGVSSLVLDADRLVLAEEVMR